MVKDNKADFWRLCEDAATLTVVVYQSREKSGDPDGWLGPVLKDAVDMFLSYVWLCWALFVLASPG
jgi:hypothetical protein